MIVRLILKIGINQLTLSVNITRKLFDLYCDYIFV